MQGRRFGSLLPTLVLSWAVLSFPAIAFPGPDSPGSALDYQAVRAHYDNGDFDRVAQSLETFLARNPVHSHDDSVFVAKHLAVVYSSNEATVEKGRQFMYRLVDLLPSSRLVDMYVQDERSRIFRKVREQFLARQHAMGVDTAGIVLPDSRVPVAPAAPAQAAAKTPPAVAKTPPAVAATPPAPAPVTASSSAFARTRPDPAGYRTSRQRLSARERLDAMQAQGSRPQSQADLVTPAERRKAPRTSYLFAGGAAFVAAAAVTYFVLSDSPGTKEKTYVVP